MKPLVIDLYTGLHGWSEAFAAEGYRCLGFDIVDMCEAIGHPRPEGCELILRDVRSLSGAELVREYGVPAVIVSSSPCQEFSYRAMPWKRAKALPPPYLGMELFQAQFRIQREICEAAGLYVPMIVENVRGAQKWVGRAQWNFGSFYLWGDVPALMPLTFSAHKVPSFRFDGSGRSFQSASVRRMNVGNGARFTSRDCGTEALYADRDTQGIKQHGSGHIWYRTGNGAMPSKSPRRKAASALIAKIPFALAQHIARTFKPSEGRSNP